MSELKLDKLESIFEYLEELQTLYGITTIEEVYEVLTEATATLK